MPAPYNLATNSQWEIFSGFGDSTRINVQGTGTLAAASMSANSTGPNLVTISVSSGDLSEWKVGDLIRIQNCSEAALSSFPMRILTKSSTQLEVRCPLGFAPTVSTTGTIIPVNIGGASSVGTGDAADGWRKDINLAVWREDNSANLLAGCRYALGCNVSSSSVTPIDQPLFMSLDPTLYRGQRLTFGAYVYQKVKGGAGTWCLFYNTGTIVTDSSAPASTEYQWLEYSFVVPTNATFLNVGIRFQGSVGDTYYVANPVLALTASPNPAIGEGQYVKPQEVLFPVVHISPWINVEFGYGTTATIAD